MGLNNYSLKQKLVYVQLCLPCKVGCYHTQGAVSLFFAFQLVSEKKIDKNLLPPKKIIGKNSKSLVEKRQKELEVYLQTLLVKFPVAAPKVLSHFLHFHFYVSFVFSI